MSIDAESLEDALLAALPSLRPLRPVCAAPSVGVVLEVDGGYHQGRVRAAARRDRELRRLGFIVVRLEAEHVIRELAVAVARIREALGARH